MVPLGRTPRAISAGGGRHRPALGVHGRRGDAATGVLERRSPNGGLLTPTGQEQRREPRGERRDADHERDDGQGVALLVLLATAGGLRWRGVGRRLLRRPLLGRRL